MIKSLNKIEIERTYHNTIKDIYEKPIANIILNSEKLKALLLISSIRQVCPLLPLLFNIILEVLARAIRKEKEIKVIQIGKEDLKQSLFVDDIILDRENLKDTIKSLLELINEFSRVTDKEKFRK